MRRMFWFSLGAVIGVTGYRRATALARSLRPQPLSPGRAGGAGASDSLAGFAADVREGMALYLDRQADRQAGREPTALEDRTRRGGSSAGPAGSPPPRGQAPGPQGRNPRRLPGRAPSRNDDLKDGR